MTHEHDPEASGAQPTERDRARDHCSSARDPDSRARDVEAILAAYDAPTTVEGRLHAVPPHEVHEVTVGGERAVCKLAAGPTADPRLEGQVLRFLAEETRVPAPEVLAVGDDHFLARWVDGLESEPTLDEARLRATGRALARLHADAANRVASAGRLRAGADGFAVAAAERWSDVLLGILEDCRPSVEALGHTDLLDDVLSFVRSHRASYDAAGEATLLHGNALPEHVALDRSGDGRAGVACVIDAEHALAGPAEYDLVRAAVPTVGPPWQLEASEPGRENWLRLRDGYESVRPLPSGIEERLALYGPVDAVRYLHALAVQRGPQGCGPQASPHELARRSCELCEYGRAGLAHCRELVA